MQRSKWGTLIRLPDLREATVESILRDFRDPGRMRESLSRSNSPGCSKGWATAVTVLVIRYPILTFQNVSSGRQKNNLAWRKAQAQGDDVGVESHMWYNRYVEHDYISPSCAIYVPCLVTHCAMRGTLLGICYKVRYRLPYSTRLVADGRNEIDRGRHTHSGVSR